MHSATPRANPRPSRVRTSVLRVGGPVAAVLVLLATLWFPFDWLSTVWPAFGIPFRNVFRTAHDHFIGHAVFFFVVGFLILALVPAWRRNPQWYLLGLVGAALMQETIQALARSQVPTYTDVNAFKGDALGGTTALLLWLLVSLLQHRATQQA